MIGETTVSFSLNYHFASAKVPLYDSKTTVLQALKYRSIHNIPPFCIYESIKSEFLIFTVSSIFSKFTKVQFGSSLMWSEFFFSFFLHFSDILYKFAVSFLIIIRCAAVSATAFPENRESTITTYWRLRTLDLDGLKLRNFHYVIKTSCSDRCHIDDFYPSYYAVSPLIGYQHSALGYQ